MIIDYFVIMKAVNNVLIISIELRYVYVKFKQINQSCSPLKISQRINVELRTCDRNDKQLFQ